MAKSLKTKTNSIKYNRDKELQCLKPENQSLILNEKIDLS